MTLFGKWLIVETSNSNFSQMFVDANTTREVLWFLTGNLFRSELDYGSKNRAQANAKRVLRFLEMIDQETVQTIQFASVTLTISKTPKGKTLCETLTVNP